MSRKMFTICSCCAICAVQGALMFVPPASAVADLMAAISFGIYGFIVGQEIE